jgi:potassium efflux system protein
LAEAHFVWPQAVRITLRKNLRWFMAVTIPLVFVSAVLYADAGLRSQDEVTTSRAFESAARSFVLALLIAAGVFTYRVLRPNGLLFRSLSESHAESRVYGMRRGIYYTVQFVLGALVVLALIGYDFTVAQLTTKLYASMLLIEVLIIGVAFANRWLVIARRRMAIAQAQQRRAQIAQQTETSGDLAAVAIAEETPDLSEMNQQSQRLLKSIVTLIGLIGFWYIWSDVVPALNFLEQFELWPATGGGKAVTINDAIIATVVVIVTILATRNIPGLLEIVVLSRLPLDTGTRYAIITICRYVLTIVGVVLAFASIGVNWSQIQWLVAAVTVGLGFGLQEIFANFVSGLIVLFEQPIRVGDIVTIGDVTGVVSRIRMRATTVTNWDRQEFIVPNKEFITGKLLNWTLSNTINRVVITAGVAYGTDPDRVRQIMLDIALEHPLVMLDPEPNVTFEQFGDSTLNVTLRCYLPDMDNRLGTIHQLNSEVHRRLNAAGIEFAFPTRELYIRSSADESSPAPGGEGEVAPGASGPAS